MFRFDQPGAQRPESETGKWQSARTTKAVSRRSEYNTPKDDPCEPHRAPLFPLPLLPPLLPLPRDCRYRDCRHQDEPNCAVRAALADGRLDAERFGSYHKLAGEARGRDESARKRLGRLGARAARQFYKLDR